jgi:hypothetical protein
MSSGAAKRSFASDEEDKRYFGPAPDQLMSDSWNMKTSIGIYYICIIIFYFYISITFIHNNIILSI